MSGDARGTDNRTDRATNAPDGPGPTIDTTKAHPARVYDVLLGGKDNYEVDREAAAAALAVNPRGYLDVRHNRDFLRRAVSHVTGTTGIRQFLDIGTGLPTRENVHQIAQRTAPDTKVVYVDNDPVVLAHARALLTSHPEGRTAYVHADLRTPGRILDEAAETLDLSRPVALVLVSVLHFVEDEEAYPVVAELIGRLAAGSVVVLSHLSADFNPVAIGGVAQTFRARGFSFVLRSREQVARFAAENGLELVEPGVVRVHEWRPDRIEDVVRAAPADPAYVASLDYVDRTKYLDITNVRDEDINLYAWVAHKR
ncbi:SAM-dependent methyltransferase [Streptomyces sp. NPDC059578]|uniref:SAM-dependent methyltransferase n=1 Tax=Streptomyces sp. NPDC059578 TaxID=3346874 RepID=UPI0036C36A13